MVRRRESSASIAPQGLPRARRRAAAVVAALGAALGAMSGAQAQYKIIGPDGSVTYTDRPPATAAGNVVDLGRRGAAPETVPAAAPAAPALPAELQRLAARYPVSLYTSANCAPCDNGRRLLQTRGIPYAERVVTSNEDIAALERIAGGRTLPVLTIGAQALRGFSDIDWAAYLDAAGYPQTSRLPAGWTAPAPTPLVARAPAPATPVAQAPEPAPQAAEAPAAALPPPAEGTIRF